MSVFTLEVAGRPVACINATTPEEAKQALDDPWFRDGLLGLVGKDRPIWHGDDDIAVRAATAEELARIEGRHGYADGRGLMPLDQGNETRTSEHRLILASRVEHTPAFNEAGERIGHIDDLSIDRRSGQVVYAIMSFGGFLGIGKRFHPLPWHMLHYDHQREGYVVPLDKRELDGAPHFDADELREFGGATIEPLTRVWEYYGKYGPPPI